MLSTLIKQNQGLSKNLEHFQIILKPAILQLHALSVIASGGASPANMLA